MALLQISEPGGAPDPHQRRIAVGIDLGTTHSLVAAVRHGVAECLPDEAGRVILPSAVRYLLDGLAAVGMPREEAYALLNEVAVVCIGPVTAATARAEGLWVAAEAGEYTLDGVVAALCEVFGGRSKF